MCIVRNSFFFLWKPQWRLNNRRCNQRLLNTSSGICRLLSLVVAPWCVAHRKSRRPHGGQRQMTSNSDKYFEGGIKKNPEIWLIILFLNLYYYKTALFKVSSHWCGPLYSPCCVNFTQVKKSERPLLCFFVVDRLCFCLCTNCNLSASKRQNLQD